MKPITRLLLAVSLLIAFLAGIVLYQKFSYTEEDARNYAKRFFNILMIKGSNKEFEEVYPLFGSGSRAVTPVLCKINSVTKRSDGDFDIYASYEASRFVIYPIYLIINRKGNIVSSRGISYAYYDKTLDYAKKIGCLTGSENDAEIERVISEKKLRSKLDYLADLELFTIKNRIDITGKVYNNWGYFNGTLVVTNNTPYSFEYGELKCSVNFLSSSGTIIDSDDIFISSLMPYASTSSTVYSSAGSATKYEYIVDVQTSYSLKNKVKDYIIRTTSENCY